MNNYDIKDYRIDHWSGFKDYYVKMMYSGDCDPSYPALNYLADRFELNIEQRYWLAYLYGLSYCVPTTYYIYNEFPDYENVNINRLKRWWKSNKDKTYFQTDRRRVKNYEGVFIKCFESYKKLMLESQYETFFPFNVYGNLKERYNFVYKFANKIYYFGRFSLFNYLETINEITDLKLEPDVLNLKQAESSRNGMCYVCDLIDFITLHHKKSKVPINYDILQHNLIKLKHELKEENPEIDVNYWNLETALCAYKKLFWNTRYLGYYIDRQMKEIKILENNVKEGVDWSVLWDFRREFFKPDFLGELNDWDDIRKKNMYYVTKYGKLMIKNFPEYETYERKVKFNNIGSVYNYNLEEDIITNIKYDNKVKIKKRTTIFDYIGD